MGDQKHTAEDLTAELDLLRRSERFYRELVESVNSVILIWDREGNITFLNEFAERFFGFSRQEIIGKNVVGTIVPLRDASGADLKGLMDRILSDPEGFRDNENENITKDGRRVWIRWTNRAITDEHGDPSGVLSVGTDITRRKQAEDSVIRSEQFIREILNTVDEGFIVVDRDFRIITANRAFCAQAGESCESVIGKHCYEMSHKASRPCYESNEECAVLHVFETGAPHSVVHRHSEPGGSILYVETKAFPLKDSGGEITSVVETVNNLSEKYLLEDERLKTQKLEAIGALAGGIAHDFNNLLQGIFGYISIAKMTLENRERSLPMLENAEQALHKAVNLTTQLLTFSRGGNPLKKTVSLRPVIENSVRFAMSGSNVGFRIDLDEDLWDVRADEGQIGQVIQNIVLNAEQAMPLGGMIRIKARNVMYPGESLLNLLKDGKYVEISVLDNGTGIPGNYLKKIFDPYFTTKVKGSGLGLATSYSIVKNHGGVITVYSEPDKGSTFNVYLPAIEAQKLIKEPPSDPADLRKGKILVMDDEELIRSIANALIMVLGHEVEVAENGEEAIAKYEAAGESGRPFDIVILDLTIRGGLGGRETIERLTALNPGIKAIVSSGYSDDAVVSEYQEYGFSASLKKPYNLEELRAALNMLLRD
ncbi:MAG: PAS domain S-box protein [Nitrospirae bacterium]|nr:PAS domain S-box protein [Nitrospirota bacterium]